MAVAIDQPFVMETLAHDSRVPRQMLMALLGSDINAAFATGINAWNKGHGVADIGVTSADGDYLVKQAGTPGMSVLIDPGFAFVRGKFSVLNQGMYGAPNTVQRTHAIAAADGVNARKDLVVLHMRDATWGGDGTSDARIDVITGTPSGSPADPSLSALNAYMVLARVNVAAGATSITNANIDDLRLPATLPYKSSSTRRALLSLAAGDEPLDWYDLDTNRKHRWNGTEWEIIDEPPQVWNVTSVLQPGAIACTTNIGRYTRRRGKFEATISITINATGTGGNFVLVTLPITLSSAEGTSGSFQYFDNGIASYCGQVVGQSSTVVGFQPDNQASLLGLTPNFAVVAGDVLRFNVEGWY